MAASTFLAAVPPTPCYAYGQMVQILTEYPDPETEIAWREFLAGARYAFHYTAPEYFKEPFIGSAKPFAVLSRQGQGGRVQGVLTGLHESSRIICGLAESPRLILHPDADGAAAADIAEGLCTLGGELITLYTWEQSPGLRAQGYQEIEQAGVVLIDLTKGPEALFAELETPRAIRTATRAGFDIRESRPEDLPDYHRMRAAWSKAKGLPCEDLDQLQRLFALRENRLLLVATHEGKLAAGSVLRFTEGGVVEYAANTSWPEYRNSRPNDLLMWKGIEWASQNGFPVYSMGGCHQFLRKFGGSIIPTFRYRLDRTFLRRHDLKAAATEKSRALFRSLPGTWQEKIKRVVRPQPGS